MSTVGGALAGFAGGGGGTCRACCNCAELGACTAPRPAVGPMLIGCFSSRVKSFWFGVAHVQKVPPVRQNLPDHGQISPVDASGRACGVMGYRPSIQAHGAVQGFAPTNAPEEQAKPSKACAL